MSEWISVKDRLPEEYTCVLVWDRANCTVSTAGYQRDGFWSGWGIMDDSDITHWMPLPEPPGEVTL